MPACCPFAPHPRGAKEESLHLGAGDLAGEGVGLVGVLDAVLVPGEHGAQLRADGLDTLVGVLLLQFLEVRGAGILVIDELLGEGAVLNALQVVFHALAAILVDDGVGVVAVLSGVRAGPTSLVQTTFKEETETDLFGEQNVLMGGVNKLVEMGFEVLTDAGYQPEIAYFEVFHELKMLVDLANEGGLNKARWSCSDTAQYGDYTSTVITDETKKRMQYQLKRIQDGSFAKEFMDDQAAGAPKFKKLQEEFSHPHLETVGPKLRAMFSWNNAEAKDKDEAESFNGKIARTQVQ